MTDGKRWTVHDSYGHAIYLTQERWEHIIDPINHPEMVSCEEQMQMTVKSGSRQQDPLNPRKYRYSKAFNDLAMDNTHIVAIVVFGYSTGENNEPVPNNYLATAYQKEIG
jgi:hypothetical protein